MEGGFGLGKAEPGAKPKETFYNSPMKGDGKYKDKVESQQGTKEGFETSSKAQYRPKMDRNQAFSEFKETAGAELVQEIEANKQKNKIKKAELKSKHVELTELKEEINKLSNEISTLKESKNVDENELKTKEYNLADMKSSYKEKYSEVKESKELTTELNKLIEENMNKLLEEFEKW